MADITVRKIRFAFDEDLQLDPSDPRIDETLPILALSMTMPYLEPYLIRTMKAALPKITDPVLAQDARHFSQQEGHHYRNHALLNDRIRDQFDDGTADQLRAIEAALDGDYRRFTKQKSLRFNLAYAEGFEAMTCSMALAMAESGAFREGALPPGGEVWSWHMAEEIEHRTVAFGVFEHLVGSYFYRIGVGTWSQWHYLSYIGRFARCMAAGLGHELAGSSAPTGRLFLRRYIRTWSPWYDPAEIDIPEGVEQLLARYSQMAEAAGT